MVGTSLTTTPEQLRKCVWVEESMNADAAPPFRRRTSSDRTHLGAETGCYPWYKWIIDDDGFLNFHNCTDPKECQSSNCLPVNNSYSCCFPPTSVANLHFDVIYDICSYSKPKNKTLSDEMFEKYGYNAAHGKFKSNDTLSVMYNDVNITFIRNDLPVQGSTLELCEELAEALGFDEGVRPCEIVHLPMDRRTEKSYYIEWTWRILVGIVGSYLTNKYLH